MTAESLRQKYLAFFKKKGHKVIPSSSLVPENDPTVLFTTAGMHPLVPYLMGEKHPLGNRLVDVQKCIRTGDIEEVGDNTHLTFFEMLGNWSLGDPEKPDGIGAGYFKKEAIGWSFEFLTEELNIPLEMLAVSVFEGEPENNIPRDEESAAIWHSLGIKKERLCYLGREDNWWGPAGKTGPCGPDTEIFYWTGPLPPPEKFDPNDERWFEIWNDVFMQYNKTSQGRFVPLKQKNVDTGMGLERAVAALQKKGNVFETELFSPIIKKIEEISSEKYQNNRRAFRIIADHLKAATFILAERVVPSNLDRGYILRRLIRRAIRYGRLLDVKQRLTSEIARQVVGIYQDIYPEVGKSKEFIISELDKEETCFNKTLENGLKEFEKISSQNISGKQAFDLYQSFGFPVEITEELAKEKGLEVDKQGFERELKKHQELSRAATAGRFKAGLADDSEKSIKYHTATHLLHAALREVLGDSVQQMGSNITPERLRFDFSFGRKLTDEEIRQVEELVNHKIEEGLKVKVEEMTMEEAKKQGALAFFRERYPDKVRVFTIFNEKTGEVFSKEICSGPHCQCLKGLGGFKILKETSSSSGVRRIKAVLQ